MKYLYVFLLATLVMACDQESATSKKTSNKTDAAKVLRGKVFEYGIYRAQRKGRVLGNLSTNTGKIVSKPVLELEETTDRIPLVKNTYFAYRYRLMDLPKIEAKKPVVDVRKVLIHPEMTLPNGTKSTGWDRMDRGRTSAGQVIAFDGYAFNEDYEMVEGDWIFQIWFQDKKMVEQKFTTYKPEKSASKDAKATSLTPKDKI